MVFPVDAVPGIETGGHEPPYHGERSVDYTESEDLVCINTAGHSACRKLDGIKGNARHDVADPIGAFGKEGARRIENPFLSSAGLEFMFVRYVSQCRHDTDIENGAAS